MYTKGFTLIELLVVVLIIAVLAAIALPQYQKAVEKSRAMEAIAAVKSVAQADQMYYMTNGEYATSFNQLDISIPWESDSKWYNYYHDAKGKNGWTLHLQGGKNTEDTSVYIGKKSGPYEGVGFMYQFSNKTFPDLPTHEIFCTEKRTDPHKFKKANGDFCEKLLHGTEVKVKKTTASFRIYRFKS